MSKGGSIFVSGIVYGKVKALPVHIVVCGQDKKKVLRAARMFNYCKVDLNGNQVRNSAAEFSRFDSKDWQCRKMLLKYWIEDPSEIEDEDLKIIRQLQMHFETVSFTGKTVGEQLRRINMLLQIAWMLGDNECLKRHFKQYLDILVANNLNRMVLVGGQYAIETTIRWRQFSVADDLLEAWVRKAVATNDEGAILNFGASMIRKNRFWTIVRLLKESLSSCKEWSQKRFNTESIRCIALHKLYVLMQSPNTAKKGLKLAQANWVSSTKGPNDVRRTLVNSIAIAKKTFINLAEPTSNQKALNAQLAQIEQKMLGAQNR